MSKQKKVLVHAYRIMYGTIQENGAKFDIMVNKPVSLDQIEQVAMFMKQSVDQARAQLDQQEHLDAGEGCELCGSPDHHGGNCRNNR